MDVNLITQIISNLGFPIACVVAMFWMLNKERDAHKAETAELSKAIENNTQVMTQVLDKLETIGKGAQSMAQYSPLFVPELNGLTSGVNPPGVYTTNNATTLYFQRMLYQRAMSVFDWTIPEEWDKNFLQYCLCYLGYSIVVDSDKIARVAAGHCGVVPQAGTLYGYGIF